VASDGEPWLIELNGRPGGRLSGLAAADPDELLIELGVDLVVASDGEPWLIELNVRPGGHLSGLAAADPARFQDAATEALARPLRALAALI
jgi:predicted ATP-grasp superfamily ATP-dependent carboligase